MMFVNVKKDYYSKVAHEMKFKTVKYVITKSTQATVTTPRNLNTVEPLLLMLVLLSFNLTNIICVSHDTIQAGSKNDLSLFFHYQTSARYVIRVISAWATDVKYITEFGSLVCLPGWKVAINNANQVALWETRGKESHQVCLMHFPQLSGSHWRAR